MRDAADLTVRQSQLFAPPPMRPWEYLTLRRRAAGLTIEQAAKPFYQRPEHRADVEANLRNFETPGVTIRKVADLDIPRAFPFDPAVYRQLVDALPDDQPRLCRTCGWDEWTQQFDVNGDETTWSAEDPSICTRCEQIAARGARRAA